MEDRARRLLPVVGLAGLVVVAFLVRHGEMGDADRVRYLTVDLRHAYFPLYEATWSWIREGQLPLWNPFHLTGVPWLSTLQAGVFYPTHWLYFFLPTNVALELSAAIHLVVIALSMAALVREIGVSRPAAALAACLFALRGFNQSWLATPSALEAGAWLCLGCLGAVEIARGERTRGVRRLVIATALSLLAGFPHVTLLCVYAWSSLLIALCIRRADRPLRPALLFGGGAMALGVAIAGVQIVPSVVLAMESARAPSILTQLEMAPSSARLGWLFTGDAASIGLVGLILAPAACWTRRRRAVVYWGGGLALASLSLALAWSWTLPLYRALPGMRWFHYPDRFLLLTHLAMAVLAAIGLDTWRRRVRDVAGPSVARIAVVVLLSAGALDLTLANTGVGTLPYDGSWLKRSRASVQRLVPLADQAGPERVTWLGPSSPPMLKLGSTIGIRWLDDYAPLALRRQAEYFGWLATGRNDAATVAGFRGRILPEGGRLSDAERKAHLAGIVSRRRLLDLASARWFVGRTEDMERPATRGLVKGLNLASRAYPDASLTLLENTEALPRAFVTYRARPAPPTSELLAILADPEFDPLDRSYVELETPLGTWGAPRGAPATLIRDSATEVTVAVDARRDGLVVLADAYAQGWTATVDGEEAAIVPANHLFRGVVVPPGPHRVTFRYRVPGLGGGMALSAVGLAGFAGMLGYTRRASRAT